MNHYNRTGVEDRKQGHILTSGIRGRDPRNLHPSREQVAAREAASTDEEAEAPPARPASPRQALCPTFPVGPATEGPIACETIGHDGTSNLSRAKATELTKQQRSVQRVLTADLRAKLDDEATLAAHSSGAAPVYLYNNDVRAVQVGKDHIWANIHTSHICTGATLRRSAGNAVAFRRPTIR